jgi:hypothetical protein
VDDLGFSPELHHFDPAPGQVNDAAPAPTLFYGLCSAKLKNV